jgi:uncharacterized protein (DUF488 family)
MNSIVSIGHSQNEWSVFVALLQSAGAEIIVDVRSSPSSRFPRFNKLALERDLQASGIGYAFLGRELGGRPATGGPADYEQMAQGALFGDGLLRLEEIAGRSQVAIMCSEHEPLQCHRFLLVGRALAERGHAVAHILRDGAIEPHAATEDRLLKLTRQTEADLLAPRAERLAIAYRNQNRRLWRLPPSPHRPRSS